MTLSGRVLITGGSGFIGRALYLAAREGDWPVQWTALSRDDHKHARLAQRFPEVQFVAGDIRMDTERLASLMRGHDIVIHAAASKHVDLAELAAWETVDVNVFGSRNVAQAAITARVPQVLGISTDKACGPSTYGITKAIMERLFQEADGLSDTAFTLCRYGNVVGSTGSVVPKFREQIARGERIHLTDPRMTRFWMGWREAVRTIVYGLNTAQRGVIAIPRPRAMTLHDLALTALGRDEHGPLPPDLVVVDGVRPGERMHEELVTMEESPRVMDFGRFYQILPPGHTDPAAASRPLFRVSSADAPGGLIGPADMAALIAESEGI